MSESKMNESFEQFESLSCFSRMTVESSITGVKFIGDSRAPEKARVFWIVTFMLSFFGCLFYGLQIYDKWNVTPDIGVKTLYEPSITIPYPAITVCHQSKIKKEFLNYSEALNTAFTAGEMGDESRKYFEIALPLCTASHINLINVLNKNYTDIVALNGSDFVQTMSKVQFLLNQTFVGVKTDKGFVLENFHTDVDRVMTSEGFCATYNIQNYKLLFRQNVDLSTDFDSYKNKRNSVWDPHIGYLNDEIDVYPKRLFGGTKSKIVFLMAQSAIDIDETCVGPEQGFKIYFHMPNEIPTFSNYSFILGVERSKLIVMKASQYRTPEDMRKFSPDKRNCYFSDENKLKFFKSYTQSHCLLECRADYLLKTCGCVSFFMPRNSSTPVCDMSKLECSVNAEEIFEANNYFKDIFNCMCLPLCTQIKYEAKHIEEMNFDTKRTLEIFEDTTDFYRDFPNGTISRLVIEFMDHIIEVHENFSVYGIQQFISDCGGLLGLFMGCSVLSIIEIFYNIFAKAFSGQRERIHDESKESYRSNENVVIYIGNEKIN